jgi:hypothetical protein
MFASLPTIFTETKRDRNTRCTKPTTCGVNGAFRCHKCRRLGQRLCRAYHEEKEPAKELYGRLLYEYVFDFVDAEKIADGKWWIESKDDSRDQGHVFRLRKLAAISGVYRLSV